MTETIPQPRGLPLLGNMLDIDPSNSWVSLTRLADKCERPIFKITVLGKQIIFITGAALLEEVCDETRFRKCVAPPIVEIRHAVHDALFTAYDSEPMWGIAHRMLAPKLSPSNVETMFTQMRDTASKLTAKWTEASRVKAIDDLQRSNIQATSLCLFSANVQCMKGPTPPVIKAMDSSTAESIKRPARPKLVTQLMGYQRQYDEDIKTMRDFAAEILDGHGSDADHDVLQTMLTSKDAETGKSLDREQVIDEIVTLFIGTTTAPLLLGYALYYLLKHPAELTKAQKEVDDVIGSGPFEFAQVAKLQYTDAILKETMRLSAVAPGFNLEPLPSAVASSEDVLLAGGKYHIPKNQMIMSLVAKVNRDPAVFDQPDEFQPARMLGDAYARLPSGVKKGFGNGKRVCIGRHYAWQWVTVTLATIVKDVDFKMADGTYTPKPYGAYNLNPSEFGLSTSARK